MIDASSKEMSLMYYSATTRGFYTESDAQPDCVEVSYAQYVALFDAQSAGKVIVPDANGFPVAEDPPPPTAAEILAMNTNQQNYMLQQASSALAPLQMAVTLGIATDDETAQAKAWVTYSRALKAVDITQFPATWPTAPGAA